MPGRPPRELMVTLGVRPMPSSQALLSMQGDPFLGGLFRALGRGITGAGRLIGRAVGGAGRLALGVPVVSPGQAIVPAAVPLPPVPVRTGTGGRSGFGLPPPIRVPAPPPLLGPGVRRVGGHFVAGGAARRRRRINPLNPRALRRSLRRIEGFRKFAMRAGFVPRSTHVRKRFPFARRRKRG